MGGRSKLKRSALIAMTVILLFIGRLNSFCTDNGSIDIFSDLTMLKQLESQKLMKSIENYSRELQYQYNEGIRIDSQMDSYGKPVNPETQPVKTHELLYTLGYKGRSIEDRSLLFRDDIFTHYFNMRTGKVLEEYKKSGKFDLGVFIGRAKQDFHIFLKEVQKDENKKKRIILLLQDKLIDKMYSDDMANRSGYLDKVLALRLVSNSEKRNQSIYELMESRVRLKLLQELVAINQEAIKAQLGKLKVTISNSESGVLSFRHISDIEKRTILEYSVYMAKDKPDYKLVLPLGRLAAIYGKATFTGKNGDVKVMSRDSIWDRIGAGEGGGLELSIDEAYISESEMPGYDIFALLPDSKRVIDISELSEREKSLENNSKEAQKLAQEITKELSALSVYTDLKSKGIYNAYTAKFDVNKKVWLANLNTKLNSMNKLTGGLKEPDTGFMGFLRYIRQYVDYTRDSAAAGLPDSSSVLVFRDTVLQFRQVEAGSLWVIDMLYQTKYLQ